MQTSLKQTDQGVVLDLHQRTCLRREDAAAHSALAQMVGPAFKPELLLYPGTEANAAQSYELLGLAPDHRPALRRFADQVLMREDFSAAPTLRFYLRNRLNGAFVGEYLRYLKSVVDHAPMHETAQLKISEKAIVFELEQLRGYRQFFETYKGTPFIRGVSPQIVLQLGLIAAYGGSYTSARTSAREALAAKIFSYLKKIPLPEFTRALVTGHGQTKINRDMLKELGSFHQRDFVRLLYKARPVAEELLADFIAGK